MRTSARLIDACAPTDDVLSCVVCSEVLEEGREGGDGEMGAGEGKGSVRIRLSADTLGGKVDPTGGLSEEVYNA